MDKKQQEQIEPKNGSRKKKTSGAQLLELADLCIMLAMVYIKTQEIAYYNEKENRKSYQFMILLDYTMIPETYGLWLGYFLHLLRHIQYVG